MKILTTRVRLPVTLPLNRVRTRSTASHLLRRKLGTRWNASLPGLGPQGALRFRGILCLLVLVLAGQVAVARAPATGTPTSINTAFVKLFGAVGAFTAKVDTQMLDAYQRETVKLVMDFAASEGKVRIEINLGQMQSKDLPPSKVTELKESGMERVISLFRPDKKVTYIVYPGTQSYLSIPLAKEDIDAFEKGLKLEKSPLGKETFDGHDCIKNKVVVTDTNGPVLQAVTWNAADLRDFPLQIEMKEKGNTVRMHFTELRFTKPDPQQFDVPAAYGLMK